LEGTLVENIISNNLHDIERHRYSKMASEYKVSVDDIKAAIKVIEGLDPKPGSSIFSPDTVYIRPDVYVVRDEDEFRIILNDDNIPNIRINGYYKRLLSQLKTLEKEEKEYLNERLRSALWLLKSLDHRNKTIYRVTESIMRFQQDFFLSGVTAIKSLNLKDVAQDLEMHESTISRATSNKFLSCTHGLFSFRFFFSSSLKSDNGDVSSTYVKDIIRKIVDQEDIRKPFSDQKISDLLEKANNIKIARRTVAKYREEMNIPPRSMRRQSD
ncbi:RNA polymerase factor sigma-54, partial [Nitrospirota bacterium]